MIGNMIAAYLGTPTANASLAFDSIQTTTVGAGGSATISFTSIPGTYTHLQIRAICRDTNATTSTVGATAQFNSDTGANYTQHVLYGTGAADASAGTASTTTLSIGNYPKGSETANAFGTFICDILDYGNTNKYKTVRSLMGYDGNNTNGILGMRTGLWMNTAAVTRIDISSASTAFAQYSSFALYGVK
ncbi:hypothetical protein UFOVP1255_8 [uncultured Caudovirales phage]|uniref:Uncharacterized protein n=1 Tax=uncultured Caudovirales phage TaxID=2100421 RepID=A0A6J5RAB5_9CAUD|nr:hypothetical protein UFOVP973_3 [uncultured Caudovirales phage]CAB4194033.1 hypothetical protein UFOVP1255_8 [uncultured Caudovirales phage]CAB4216892.1 hypothetical protein UFOVP1496_15 [uncultured Caudovirales phage]